MIFDIDKSKLTKEQKEEYYNLLPCGFKPIIPKDSKTRFSLQGYGIDISFSERFYQYGDNDASPEFFKAYFSKIGEENKISTIIAKTPTCI